MLADLLDRDGAHWRHDLDERHAVLHDALAGARPAILYPAGRMARRAAPGLLELGVNLIAFGDRDLHGKSIGGLPVISAEEIARDHADAVVLVASTLHDSAILVDLALRGHLDVVPVAYLIHRLPELFPARELLGALDAAADPANREQIENAAALFEDGPSRATFEGKLAYYLTQQKRHITSIRTRQPIYFDPDIYTLRHDEAVVDGGAYKGDTLTQFVALTNGRFDSYHAFEPDTDNLPDLRAASQGHPRVEIVDAALGRSTTIGRLVSLQGFDFPASVGRRARR